MGGLRIMGGRRTRAWSTSSGRTTTDYPLSPLLYFTYIRNYDDDALPASALPWTAGRLYTL